MTIDYAIFTPDDSGFPNSAPPHHFFSHLHKSHWTDNASFPYSSDRSSDIVKPTAACEPRTFLRGIDVNSLPATTGDEEDLKVSSPNSIVSSISGKRSEREATHGGSIEEKEMERACSRGISDEEDDENSRKKLRLSKDQSAILEETFKNQKLALACVLVKLKSGFRTGGPNS